MELEQGRNHPKSDSRDAQLTLTIEQVFAKLKTLLRKANEGTIKDTWQRIGKLLDPFTKEECANYVRHAGYGAT